MTGTMTFAGLDVHGRVGVLRGKARKKLFHFGRLETSGHRLLAHGYAEAYSAQARFGTGTIQCARRS